MKQLTRSRGGRPTDRDHERPVRRRARRLTGIMALAAALGLAVIPGVGVGQRVVRDGVGAALPSLVATPAAARLVIGSTHDPAVLASGRETFVSICAPCHRADDGGGIGPNLTDHAWIYGGTSADIVRSITNGYPSRGMPVWGEVLSPEQIANVAAYVVSLRGTHPPGGKSPQGVPDADEGTDGVLK